METSAPLLVRPRIVTVAVMVLWAAWILSGCMTLYFHQLAISLGLKSNFGLLAGACGLVVQAIAIYFLGRGNRFARILAIILLVVALPGVYYYLREGFQYFPVPASLSLLGVAARCVAVGLVFTTAARPWFQQSTN